MAPPRLHPRTVASTCVLPRSVGLGRPPDGMFFVILVLAGVAYDGLLAILLWLEL